MNCGVVDSLVLKGVGLMINCFFLSELDEVRNANAFDTNIVGLLSELDKVRNANALDTNAKHKRVRV